MQAMVAVAVVSTTLEVASPMVAVAAQEEAEVMISSRAEARAEAEAAGKPITNLTTAYIRARQCQ